MASDKERLASEAQRLLNEPLLVQAMDSILKQAFEDFQLLRINPETVYDVIALQQRINAVLDVKDKIESYILASGQMDGGVKLENKPGETIQ